MFAKSSTVRRSRMQRRRRSYRPIAEVLEKRRLLAAETFSYVDADNSGDFDPMVDIDVSTEVADGNFDTAKAEGAYLPPDPTMFPTPGLYISTVDQIAGINVPGDIDYKADGNLTINTFLTSGDDIQLESRNGSVSLDDPTLTAPDDIEIQAALDISSTLDQINAGSDVELHAGSNIILSSTHVDAGDDIRMEAGGNVHLGSTTPNPPNGTINPPTLVHAADDVEITAGGTIELLPQTITGTQAPVPAEIEASSSSGEVALKAFGPIFMPGAKLDAGKKIELDSDDSSIHADGAMIGAHQDLTPRYVEFDALNDIEGDGIVIEATRDIELSSKAGSILAPNSNINGNETREIILKAQLDIDLDAATVAATRRVYIKAHGNISANDAVIQALGSSRADIELRSYGSITVQRAQFTAEDDVTLIAKGGDLDATDAFFTAEDIELDAFNDLLYCLTNVIGDLDTDWGGTVDPNACLVTLTAVIVA